MNYILTTHRQSYSREVKNEILFTIFSILLLVICTVSMIFMIHFDVINKFIGNFKISNTSSDKYDIVSIYIPISGMVVSYLILLGTIHKNCYSLRKPFKINLCALIFIIIILIIVLTRIDIVLGKIKHTDVISTKESKYIHKFIVLQGVMMCFLVLNVLVNIVGLVCK